MGKYYSKATFYNTLWLKGPEGREFAKMRKLAATAEYGHVEPRPIHTPEGTAYEVTFTPEFITLGKEWSQMRYRNSGFLMTDFFFQLGMQIRCFAAFASPDIRQAGIFETDPDGPVNGTLEDLQEIDLPWQKDPQTGKWDSETDAWLTKYSVHLWI